MRTMTTIKETEALLAFAKKAGAAFSGSPDMATFGDVTPGSLLAIRWGLGNDCVLVVKLDEDFIPVNFQDAARPA